MIERLPAGTAGKKRARDVHHMRRTRALIKQRRAASRAKAPHGFRDLVLETRNPRLALGDAKPLAPASDIGRVSRAMRAAAAKRMIVPGPAGWYVDLEADPAAQALTGGNSTRFRFFCHLRLPSPASLRGAKATKQSIFRRSGMVRRTRPGISRFRVRCFASPRNDRSYSPVIASEAKQSISPRIERMDCFVASLLAMTVDEAYTSPPPSVTRRKW